MDINTDYKFEINLDDLLGAMNKNVKKDITSFEDVIDLDGALRREIYLGDIENGTGSFVDGYIRFWNSYDNTHNISAEERNPIKIYVDSYGGSLLDTFTMIDSIKMSKTPIWTICTGAAYSGGFFTFICGHRRIAYPHASFLFHEGATGNSGTAGQFENYSIFYTKQLDQLKKIVIENTNITEEEYKNIKKDDIWYDTTEALEKDIVDEIAEELV